MLRRASAAHRAERKDMNTPLLDQFSKRGRDFLGVEYPFICGAMTWVSDARLVAAVCNAGGFACLAGGNTPVDILEQQIEEVNSDVRGDAAGFFRRTLPRDVVPAASSRDV